MYENISHIFFWVVSVIAALLWFLFLTNLSGDSTQLTENFVIQPYFSGVLIIFTYLSVGAALFEVPKTVLLLGMSFAQKHGEYFRLQAIACFRVATDAISKSCNKKEISYFKAGIDYLNDYLKLKYSAQLRKGKEYVNYFKTVAFAGTSIEKQIVKEVIDDLIDLRRNLAFGGKWWLVKLDFCQKYVISNKKTRFSQSKHINRQYRTIINTAIFLKTTNIKKQPC